MEDDRTGEAGTSAGGRPGPSLRPRFLTADQVRRAAEHHDAPMRGARRARPAQGRKDEADLVDAPEQAPTAYAAALARQLDIIDRLTAGMRQRVASCPRSQALVPKIETAMELRRELEPGSGLRRVRGRDSKAVMLRRRQMRILRAAITVMKRSTVPGNANVMLEDDIAALADLYRDLGGSIGELDMDCVNDGPSGPAP